MNATITSPAPVDFDRDRWGRPLVVPPGGGNRAAYTRSSSAAKTIEDTYNLELWARRNVAFGFSRDASLVARVLAIGGDPSTWDQPTRNAVNKIVEDAAQIALAHKGADIGTAVHTLTERLDRGEDVVGGPYQADLDAYRETLTKAGLSVRPEWVECRMVCDSLQLAGTVDRIVVAADGRNYIADLKTSATVDFGALGWSAQLAAYAHSDLYDPAAGTRLPTPAIDRTVGFIIHLPAGKGTCTLHDVDLVQGYRAAMLANEVRAIRKAAKGWLAAHQPVVLAALTPAEQHQAIDALDGDGHPDEGVNITEHGPNSLEARYKALSAEARAWIGSIALEAKQARRGFGLNEVHTTRRFEILRALVLLAEAGVDELAGPGDIVRTLVAKALDSDAPLFPAVTVGEAVGALDAVRATAFALEVDAHLTAGGG